MWLMGKVILRNSSGTLSCRRDGKVYPAEEMGKFILQKRWESLSSHAST
jgi:hypothetical protein